MSQSCDKGWNHTGEIISLIRLGEALKKFNEKVLIQLTNKNNRRPQ